MVTRSLKYVESFLPEMIKSGEILLEPQEMFLLEKDLAYKSITSKQIQEKLEKFCKKSRQSNFHKNHSNFLACFWMK